MSSACVCHIVGEWCFYCEMYLPLEAENERLKTELKAESLRAAEWEGEAVGYAEENEMLRAEIAKLYAAYDNGVPDGDFEPVLDDLFRALSPILFPEVLE